MPVDKSIPEDDPCSNAGDRIRELISGEGKPPEGDEKLALANVCLRLGSLPTLCGLCPAHAWRRPRNAGLCSLKSSSSVSGRVERSRDPYTLLAAACKDTRSSLDHTKRRGSLSAPRRKNKL